MSLFARLSQVFKRALDGTEKPTHLHYLLNTKRNKRIAAEREQHLIRILRAIHKINRLIVREKNPEKLLQGVCNYLIETRGYQSVWISLLESPQIRMDTNERLVLTAQAGFGENFSVFKDKLYHGKLSRCVEKALYSQEPDVVFIKHFSDECFNCLFQHEISDRAVMTVRLEYEKRIFGIIYVSIHNHITVDEEYMSLFQDISRDIAYALYSIELERKRKQAEQALHDSERRYALIAKNLPNGIVQILDNNFKNLFSEGEELKKLGLTNEDLVGKTIYDIIPPEAAARAANHFRRVLTGETVVFEHQYRDQTFLVNAVPLGNRAGKINQILVLSVNITEHRKIEQARIESEERFRTAVENFPGTFAIYDSERRYQYINAFALNRSGLKESDFINRRDEDIFPEDLIGKYVPVLEKTISSKTPQTVECMLTLNGTDYTLIVNYIPLLNERNELYQILGITRDITEQRRILDALQESQRAMTTLLSNLPGMAYRCRNDEYYTMEFVSKGCLTLTGYKDDDLLQNNSISYEELMFRDDRQRVREKIQESLEKRQAFEITYRIITASGERRCVREFGQGVFKDNGELLALEGFIMDITESKRAESELQNAVGQLKKLETIINRSPAVAILWRAEQNWPVEYISENIHQFGYTPDDFHSGKLQYQELVHPEDRRRVSREASDYIKKDVKYFKQAYRILTQSGEVRHIDDWTWLRKNQKGQITHLEGIIVDVTGRRQVEVQLARLASVIEQASESIIITDLSGKIEYVNPAFEQITGYTASEVRGKNPSILKSGKQDTEFYHNLWIQISSGQAWNGRFINRKKDGTLFQEDAAIFPIKDASGKIINYAAVKRDITRELILEESLHQSQKLESIGQLTGGIAHDFNNILTVINGYSEIALTKTGNDPALSNDITRVREAGERASNLVRQLLAFSRKQVIEPRLVDINKLISDLDMMVRRIIGEDITMEISLAADLRNIMADPAQVEQIIMNLLINARDAIHQKTNGDHENKIIIETKNVYLDEEYVESHVGASVGDHVLVSIGDTGVGMSENVSAKIFEPFFTTKAKGKGTGLGLATVYGIVKQNKGSIRVYSEPGVGTSFKIYWPSVSIEYEAETTMTSLAEVTGGAESILFVEDEQLVRSFGQQALKKLGYHVIEARNGVHALSIVTQQNHKVDLVITDVIMPNMGGQELVKHLKENGYDLKIMFTSGYTDNQITRDGILDRDIYFLQKPYSIKDLARKVREVLDS